MKKTVLSSFLVASLMVGLVSCSNEANVGADEINSAHIDPENPPVMEFETPLYDFGTISKGQVVKYSFEFTNTGKSDLLIQSARGSCGCTVPKSWPKDPVKPGETGTIEVNFDSEHKSGKQDVTVTILANTVPTKNEVKLTGFVASPNE
ncbi:MAG: DUF1573 domain-containing protein [Flavobacteriales bacterium]|nr:DUF1573 domain-containing protein [Flavobacteriales bacterium]